MVANRRYRLPFLTRLLKKWPGEKRFGMYRFLPLFFVLGGLVEYVMINAHVGEVNFYRVYQQKEAQRLLERRDQTDALALAAALYKQNEERKQQEGKQGIRE